MSAAKFYKPAKEKRRNFDHGCLSSLILGVWSTLIQTPPFCQDFAESFSERADPRVPES